MIKLYFQIFIAFIFGVASNTSLATLNEVKEARNWTLYHNPAAWWEVNYLPYQILERVPGLRIIRKLENSDLDNIKDRLIVVRSWDDMGSANSIQFANELISKGFKAFIFYYNGQEFCHISAQCCGTEGVQTLSRLVPIIIRNYFALDCVHIPNIIWAPLGSVSGNFFKNFSTATPSVHKRHWVWSFMSKGQRPVRDVFVAKMLELNTTSDVDKYPFKLRYLPQEKYEVKPGEYEETLRDTVFSVSPEGSNAATWRFHESLLNGAIPVINRTTLIDYYQYFLPCNITRLLVTSPHPAPIIRRLMQNLNDLEHRRKRLIGLYELWLEEGKQRLADRILSLGETGSIPNVTNDVWYRAGLSHGDWDYRSCLHKRTPVYHFHHSRHTHKLGGTSSH